MSYWWPFRSRYLPLTFGKRALLLFAFLSCLLIIWYIGCNTQPIWKRVKNAHNAESSPCIVLWWTNIGVEKMALEEILCGYNKCFFTNNREYLPQAKAILFYASSLSWHDLPLPRQPEQIWALLHEESPRNVLEFLFEDTLQHFNYTSTFSRYSDFPLTINALPDITEITNPKYVVTIGSKNIARNQLAPILFLQSDCSTMSARTNYVEELMQYIPIDSYGRCLNNRQMPESLQHDFLNNLYTEAMYRFIGQYKFMISIENGVCEDYITEKYWRPLIAGTVPIYFGSPSIRDWEPHNHSTIYITDYQNPKELAKCILELDKNDNEYVKYLQHKYKQIKPITNQRLIEEFSVRNEEVMFFSKFACQVLQALWAQNAKVKMANRLHYNCPLPLPYPDMEKEPTELRSWNSLLKRAKCMAQSIDELLRINREFTEQELHDLTNEKMNHELC
ncbi:alpha-(1,3)-fucosyltransferase B-like isoform X2 [Zeugodacus cucurbitae]|uniref:alpha-(1,3)-fucosyltransferase B-like isoform X2 n=1 Tax=Zeugodacus cucurbitae TaxID=28588 RepID=UPI0023D8E57E|nr:alpha-(1,3)-fucosyltransferase B-like isoform X2 [Zeugodacus cucurbitae]